MTEENEEEEGEGEVVGEGGGQEEEEEFGVKTLDPAAETDSLNGVLASVWGVWQHPPSADCHAPEGSGVIISGGPRADGAGLPNYT